MVDKKSIFTNIEDFNDDKEEDVSFEILEAQDKIEAHVAKEEFDTALDEKKMDMLRDMVGVPKRVEHNPEVLPHIDIQPIDTTSAIPKSLTHLKQCPRCNNPLGPSIAINGSESATFKECIACNTLVNTFKPIKYQADYMERPERYTMLAGGFGSGKSMTNIQQVIKHLMLIPNARVVVAAKTYPALEATFVKDFFSIMPQRLLRKKNEQKREWVFTNGSELMLRSFDDETKLRGINATMFVLLEASNIQHEGFELAQNRIRNSAALIPSLDAKGMPVMKYDEKAKLMRPVYKYDARKILIETNPDAGWVKKKFLVDSSTVSYYGSAHKEGYRMNTKTDPNKFTMVMATDANPYLPEGFIEEQTRGKSVAYVQQFFYGSFNFSDNTVYPNVGGRIVRPHELPPAFDERGKRSLYYLIGLDYGITDALAIIYAAYSTITKKLYIFDEVYEHNLSVRDAVKKHREKLKLHKIRNDMLLSLPLFDGRSYNKRESDLQTIGAMFNNEGLYFKPSFTYVDARVVKVNGIINDEQIEIFSNCEFLIEEVTNYKFKVSKDGSPSDKPMDKNNHAINALEFVIMELPLNLNSLDIASYIPMGTLHAHNIEEELNSVSQGFNPYQGGQVNGRSTTRNTHNLYPNSHRSRSLYDPRKQNNEEDEDEGQLFRAYIPRGGK